MIEHTRSTLALAGVVLLAIFMFGKIDHTVPPFSSWDLVAYLNMAEAAPGLADNVGLPYASRLLGPLLAGLGPLPAPEMFRIFTIMTSLVLPLLFFRFLTERGLDRNSALTAVILFVLNKQFFGFNLWNYFQLNDMLGLLFLAVLFGAMLRGRWVLFGVILFLGAMTRETTMIMVPVAVLYLWDEGRLKKEGGRLLAAAVPGVVLLIVLKLALPARGFTILGAFKNYSVKAAAWRTWFYLFVNSVAPLTFLPLVFYHRTAAFFRARRYALLFVALVSLSAFFGSNNERLMAPVFVVFYWLIADILAAEFAAGPSGARWFLVLCGLAAAFHQTYTRFGFLEKPLVVGLSLGSLLLVTIASIMFAIRRKKGTRSGLAGS
ncbi:MAG: hypothetical protein ABFS42_09350 [Candidatus Krumholzibacteriota bacterium]